LSNFKKRNNIKEHYKSGEAASAPLDNLPIFRTELRALISQYNLNDVYNADETGLYWKLEPSKSLSNGPLIGTKKPKDRVTIMLACNVTGTHKLPVVFIHRYKNPKCIRNIDKKTLPVWYYWNNASWMQRSIFQSWIKCINELMQKQQRNILLLVDNVSSHQLEEGEVLSNIKLHFLPPNTTTHLQPIDQGIIHSFKSNYRKYLCKDRIDAFDRFQEYGTEIHTLNILNAIDWVAESWKDVTNDVIYRCWKRTNILPNKLEIINNEQQNNSIEIEDEVIIQSLINQIIIDDITVKAKDYIEVDNTLETSDIPNDDEIIAAIQEAPDNEEEDNENEILMISNKIALESIQNLHNYLQQNSDIKVNSLFISGLRDLKWKIDRKRINSLTQMNIDSYLE
jgi:hypothetical protein